MRFARLGLLVLFVSGCDLFDDDDDVEVTRYDVSGVAVLVENDNGPDVATMTLAAETYRREAQVALEIDAATDDVIWDELAEIRWKDGSVPPIGGRYDSEKLTIELEYAGCIVDPPLFRMLATHYHYELTGEQELPAERVTWAEELSAANTALCAR